jgi:AcrR family transcriptional regulator
MTADETQPAPADVRALIIEAALRCYRKQGVRKTTIVDIGRTAVVSRSTIYDYFSDKSDIATAVWEHNSKRFYRTMARAMDGGDSLEDKLALAAVTVVKAGRFMAVDRLADAGEAYELIISNSAALLAQCRQFLAGYLTAAKLTGEVRKDLDVEQAAEWFARVLFSFLLTPPDLVDTSGSVAELVRAYAVRGLISAESTHSRRAPARRTSNPLRAKR